MRSERFYPISLISRFFAEKRAYSKGCWIFRMPRELASILAPKRRRRFSGSIELISEQSTWFQPLRSISTTATYSSSIRPVEAFRWVYAEIATERRSEEHTSELQSLMRISYAVFCLKKKTHAYITPLPDTNTHPD